MGTKGSEVPTKTGHAQVRKGQGGPPEHDTSPSWRGAFTVTNERTGQVLVFQSHKGCAREGAHKLLRNKQVAELLRKLNKGKGSFELPADTKGKRRFQNAKSELKGYFNDHLAENRRKAEHEPISKKITEEGVTWYTIHEDYKLVRQSDAAWEGKLMVSVLSEDGGQVGSGTLVSDSHVVVARQVAAQACPKAGLKPLDSSGELGEAISFAEVPGESTGAESWVLLKLDKRVPGVVQLPLVSELARVDRVKCEAVYVRNGGHEALAGTLSTNAENEEPMVFAPDADAPDLSALLGASVMSDDDEKNQDGLVAKSCLLGVVAAVDGGALRVVPISLIVQRYSHVRAAALALRRRDPAVEALKAERASRLLLGLLEALGRNLPRDPDPVDSVIDELESLPLEDMILVILKAVPGLRDASADVRRVTWNLIEHLGPVTATVGSASPLFREFIAVGADVLEQPVGWERKPEFVQTDAEIADKFSKYEIPLHEGAGIDDQCNIVFEHLYRMTDTGKQGKMSLLCELLEDVFFFRGRRYFAKLDEGVEFSKFRSKLGGLANHVRLVRAPREASDAEIRVIRALVLVGFPPREKKENK